MAVTKKTQRTDVLAEKVLLRFKTGMARGFLVVDENVEVLAKPLQEANFHIIRPEKGLKDEKIIKELLGNRVIVTRNPKDFVATAPVYDYGIIDLTELPFIDKAPSFGKNQTAKMISKAYTRFHLASLRSGFKLTLVPTGKHRLLKLE